MESNVIPPNLHFKKPKQGIEAFEAERIKIVTQATPFKTKKGLIGKNKLV